MTCPTDAAQESGPRLAAALDGDPRRMALSKADKEWISSEIAAKGWKRTLAAIGTPIAIIGVFVTCIGVALTAAYVAFGHVREDTEFRTKTNLKLDGITQQVTELRALMVSARPSDPANQKKARELILEARKKTIKLAESTVQQAGDSFVAAAPADQQAWDVALDFASYRSSLNASELPVTFARTYDPVDVTTTFIDFRTVKGKALPRALVKGPRLPLDKAARLEILTSPQIQPSNYGSASYALVGGAINLNGMSMRHVVLDGVEVQYSGAPVMLEDVTFVNCTFVFENNEPGRGLVRDVLASTKISFRGPA